MFGLIKKKLMGILHEFAEGDMSRVIDERERRGLRRQKVIEDALTRIENRPTEELMNFAENFALFCQKNDGGDEETNILLEKLEALLLRFGLRLIHELGAAFDPELHESCMTRSCPDFADNSVIEVIRAGFIMDGKIVRHALVVVNRVSEQDD